MSETFTTHIPARLDRLPWSRFHWLVVVALGITWILDGLEVTLVGSLSPAIESTQGLGFSGAQIGLAASAYILGAVIGALGFGRLTDTYGRRKLFTITVLVYMTATIATGFAWNFWSFILFRLVTGAGIGGEYGAVNSAIQELVPARRRGVTDLTINGSFWVGAALGAMASLVVLNPRILPQDFGWRLAFGVGGALALIIVFVRRYIPESPRWLMTHGRVGEAETTMAAIEARVALATGVPTPPSDELDSLSLVRLGRVGWLEVLRTLVFTHTRRTILGIVLMSSQAFCYNAIFFTYALILNRFYGVPGKSVGWFILPFALGNFTGPLLLGPLFDSWGRKVMIAGTYAIAGILLCLSGWLFSLGLLTAATQTAAWTVIFFFASAAASAAYLTVGECFPLETRAVTISMFFAFGTLIGGVGGPALFGRLIDTGEPGQILDGYLLGGGLMIVAAITALVLGVRAERLPLEEVAAPLSAAERPAKAPGLSAPRSTACSTERRS